MKAQNYYQNIQSTHDMTPNTGTSHVGLKDRIIYDSKQAELQRQEESTNQYLDSEGSSIQANDKDLFINASWKKDIGTLQVQASDKAFSSSMREITIPLAREGLKAFCLVVLFSIAVQHSLYWLVIILLAIYTVWLFSSSRET